jgi:aquaporin Z
MDEISRLNLNADVWRKYLAEFIGTGLLVFAGVGAAVFTVTTGGTIVVALSFGLVLLALYYALGPTSGAHFNPAVTLGVLLSQKISVRAAIGYWIAQVVGGIAGAAVLFGLVREGHVVDQSGALGSNSYGAHINAGGAIVVEFILTLLFVLVVLLVSSRIEQTAIRGTAIGLALGLCNLVAIPLDGASINPARSIGPAIFQGGTALHQVWLFILVPLIAGGTAAAIALLFAQSHDEQPERRRAAGRGKDWRAVDVRTGVERTGDEAATRAAPARTNTKAKRPARRG